MSERYKGNANLRKCGRGFTHHGETVRWACRGDENNCERIKDTKNEGDLDQCYCVECFIESCGSSEERMISFRQGNLVKCDSILDLLICYPDLKQRIEERKLR